jgi:disulfide bond formation protein DsbB
MAAMPTPYLLSHRTSGLLAAIAAAVVLGIAIASQRWGGLVPCALCLVERWPYRIAIVLGLAAALLPTGAARIALVLLALTMLGGTVLGAIHVGVEFHWWPSPLPECAALVSQGGSAADLLASMPAFPSKPCDDPTYLIRGLKLSMAEMNFLFAGLFFVMAGWVAIRKPMS